MAISCFDIETTRAIISTAQDLRAPIIVNVVQEHMVNHCDSELIAPTVKLLVQRASAEVTLSFDHEEEIGYLRKAFHDRYPSAMVDVFRYDLEGSIKMTEEIIEFAKQFDVSVKGGIGYIGSSESGDYTNDVIKTGPQQALRSVKEVGIGTLAISFGSSHGSYPEGYVPEFDFERLKEIREPTRMPSVLHGGSGFGDKSIENRVRYGTSKINVGCDFMNTNVDSIKKHLGKNPNISCWIMIHQAEIDSRETIRHYIRLSESKGKSP